MVPCPSFERCGACPWLAEDYTRQLEWKRETVLRAFRSEGLAVPVRPVCGMDDPFHYRNKVIAAVSMRGSRVVCGLYEEGSHRVVPLSDCRLQDRRINAVLSDLTAALNDLKIKPFGYGGTLKHILLRVGVKTGQVMVVLVTSEELMHGRKELLARLKKSHPEIVTVVQNVQPRQTSVVLGPRERVLYGPGFILDELLDLRYKISACSFFQINSLQTERLYGLALSLAALRPGETLLDAYCGIGTIGLSAAGVEVQKGPIRTAGAGETGAEVQKGLIRTRDAAEAGAVKVIGVEINGDAVRDAVANARANGIRNARFYCADVSAFMRDFDAGVDVLMLDPPRAGCDLDFLHSVLRLSPARIVYVSCNPETQARDIAFLTRRGRYRIASDANPVDMFPHTAHIENVLALARG